MGLDSTFQNSLSEIFKKHPKQKAIIFGIPNSAPVYLMLKLFILMWCSVYTMCLCGYLLLPATNSINWI